MKTINGKIFLSKSDITAFLNSPDNWKAIYLEGEEVEQTYWMWIGQMLHQFNEFLFRAIRIDKGRLQLPQIPDIYLYYKNGRDNEHLTNLILKLMGIEIERFNKLTNKDKFFPKHVEVKLYNHNLGIYGIIDRVDYDVEDTEKVLPVEIKSSDYEANVAPFEGCLYYLIMKGNEQFKDILARKCKIIYVKTGLTKIVHIDEKTEEFTLRVLKDIREKMEEMIKEYKAENNE